MRFTNENVSDFSVTGFEAFFNWVISLQYFWKYSNEKYPFYLERSKI